MNSKELIDIAIYCFLGLAVILILTLIFTLANRLRLRINHLKLKKRAKLKKMVYGILVVILFILSLLPLITTPRFDSPARVFVSLSDPNCINLNYSEDDNIFLIEKKNNKREIFNISKEDFYYIRSRESAGEDNPLGRWIFQSRKIPDKKEDCYVYYAVKMINN